MGLDLAQRGAHAGAFDLEAADGAALAHGFTGQGIVFGDGSQEIQTRLACLGQAAPQSAALVIGYITQYTQTADAEQIHLDQPQALDRLQVELGDEHTLGSQQGGRQIGQASRGNDHAAGMDRQVVGLSDQGSRLAKNFLVLGRWVFLGQTGVRIVVRCVGIRRAVPALREAFCQGADLPGGQPIGFGHLAQRRAAAETVDGADHGDALAPETLVDEVDDPIPAL